jgi:hypothetical protein
MIIHPKPPFLYEKPPFLYENPSKNIIFISKKHHFPMKKPLFSDLHERMLGRVPGEWLEWLAVRLIGVF